MDGVSSFEPKIGGSPRKAIQSSTEALHDSKDVMDRHRSGRKTLKQEVRISNKMGLHARPAMQFVDLANKFSSKITVSKGSQCVNGKSIMEMMLLAAGEGTTLLLTADGTDAQRAVEALKELVDSKFDEE